MKNMKKKLMFKIGDTSVKLAEKAVQECWMFGFYEPKIPTELLTNNKAK